MSIDDDPQPTHQDSTCASATMCGLADSGHCSAAQSRSPCPSKLLRGTARHDPRDHSPRKAAVESSTDPPQLQAPRPDSSQPDILPPVRMGPPPPPLPPPPPPPPPPPAWRAPAAGHARTEQQQQQQAWQRQVPSREPRFNPLPPVPGGVSALGALTAQQQQPWPGLTAGSCGVFMPVGWVGAPGGGLTRLSNPGVIVSSCVLVLVEHSTIGRTLHRVSRLSKWRASCSKQVLALFQCYGHASVLFRPGVCLLLMVQYCAELKNPWREQHHNAAS